MLKWLKKRKSKNELTHHFAEMPLHEIIVYDENGDFLETTMESISATHKVRIKHEIGDYIVYSFDTYYNNGFFLFGEIPYPPFPGAYLKHCND